MNHAFNIDIATDYGVNEAIILQNIYFWIEKNIANEKHFYDGKYWTYNSAVAFCKLFPYFTESQIRRVLNSLKEQGLILTGNYNKVSYDRTLWYTLTTKAICYFDKSISRNRQMDLTESSNRINENETPIPYINTDKKTNIKTDKKVSNTKVLHERDILLFSYYEKGLSEHTNKNVKFDISIHKESIKQILAGVNKWKLKTKSTKTIEDSCYIFAKIIAKYYDNTNHPSQKNIFALKVHASKLDLIIENYCISNEINTEG